MVSNNKEMLHERTDGGGVWADLVAQVGVPNLPAIGSKVPRDYQCRTRVIGADRSFVKAGGVRPWSQRRTLP